MPYTITMCDTILTKYTVTTPNWVCEWIVGGQFVKRECYIVSDYMNLDITCAADRLQLDMLLPEIVHEVNTAINEWTKAGDTYASQLLSPENIPMYLQYRKELK